MPPLPRDLRVVKVRPAPVMEPIRAVQLLMLAAADYAQLNQRFQAFRAAGVNTVILRVFHNPGDRFLEVAHPHGDRGVYFRTEALPVVDDVLFPIIVLAHQNNLKLFAWMTTRYADYGSEEETDFRCQAFDFAAGKTVPARGQSVLLPEVQERLLAVYRDLARYPIDGLLLQDDLMLRHHEDWNPRVVALYLQTTGQVAEPKLFYQGVHPQPNGKYRVDHYTPEFWQWTRWKRDRLLELAGRLRETVQAERPGIPVGVNLYYETAARPEEALAWFSQELSAAAAGNFEFLSLMLYHRQMQRELGLTQARLFDLMNSEIEQFLAASGPPSRAVVKFQTVDWETGRAIPDAELRRCLALLAGHPGISAALVPAGAGLNLKLVADYYLH